MLLRIEILYAKGVKVVADIGEGAGGRVGRGEILSVFHVSPLKIG